MAVTLPPQSPLLIELGFGQSTNARALIVVIANATCSSIALNFTGGLVCRETKSWSRKQWKLNVLSLSSFLQTSQGYFLRPQVAQLSATFPARYLRFDAADSDRFVDRVQLEFSATTACTFDLVAVRFVGQSSAWVPTSLADTPHTSAGRVPTDKGYRFFVDSLLTVQPLGVGQLQELQGHIQPGEPQRVINAASQLLSGLTHFAGVVVSPKQDTLKIRQIEFVSLSDSRILLILVTTAGDVQNRILFTKRAYSPSELVTAANYLNQHFAGLAFQEIRRRIQDELKQLRTDMTELMSAAVEAGKNVRGRQRLRGRQALWRSLAEGFDQSGEHARNPVGLRYRDGDQAGLDGFGGSERLAGQVVAAGGPRGEFGQQGQGDDRRSNPDAGLGQPECAARPRHDDVARPHQTHTARADVPVDDTDDGQWTFHDGPQQRGHLAGPRGGHTLRVGRTSARLAEVGARTESAAGAGEYDDAALVVPVDLLEGAVQGLDEFEVQCVEFVRPVQGQDGDLGTGIGERQRRHTADVIRTVCQVSCLVGPKSVGIVAVARS